MLGPARAPGRRPTLSPGQSRTEGGLTALLNISLVNEEHRQGVMAAPHLVACIRSCLLPHNTPGVLMASCEIVMSLCRDTDNNLFEILPGDTANSLRSRRSQFRCRDVVSLLANLFTQSKEVRLRKIALFILVELSIDTKEVQAELPIETFIATAIGVYGTPCARAMPLMLPRPRAHVFDAGSRPSFAVCATDGTHGHQRLERVRQSRASCLRHVMCARCWHAIAANPCAPLTRARSQAHGNWT